VLRSGADELGNLRASVSEDTPTGEAGNVAALADECRSIFPHTRSLFPTADGARRGEVIALFGTLVALGFHRKNRVLAARVAPSSRAAGLIGKDSKDAGRDPSREDSDGVTGGTEGRQADTEGER
jgi:hypothetical protein